MPITQDPKTQPQKISRPDASLKAAFCLKYRFIKHRADFQIPFKKRIDKSCRRQYLSRKIRFFKPKGYGSLPSSGTYMAQKTARLLPEKLKRRLIFFILQPGFLFFCNVLYILKLITK